MCWWILLAGALHLPAGSAATHPLYLSVMEMQANPRTGRLECAVKLFSDDLEGALRQTRDPQGPAFRGLEHPGAEEAIEAYLRRHIRARAGQREAEFRWVGREGNPDAQWIYFELHFGGGGLPDSLDLQWTTLLEELEGQKNILHLKGTPTRTFILDRSKPKVRIPLAL